MSGLTTTRSTLYEVWYGGELRGVHIILAEAEREAKDYPPSRAIVEVELWEEDGWECERRRAL